MKLLTIFTLLVNTVAMGFNIHVVLQVRELKRVWPEGFKDDHRRLRRLATALGVLSLTLSVRNAIYYFGR